ncbi:MAG: DNA recombination protein RmuC [Kiritimatiellae bacterium]|nr:DNA recombination protein RmuC [Kiritimatiellia bacterium]
MTTVAVLALVVVAALLGGLTMWLWMRSRMLADRASLDAALAARNAHIEEASRREASLAAELAAATQRAAAAERRAAALEAELAAERRATAEKLAVLEQARAALEDSFKAISADALRANAHSFLELAQRLFDTAHAKAAGQLDQHRQAVENLVAPVREDIRRIEATVQALESKREGAYEGLLAQVRQLMETQERLRTETGQLVRALRTPQTRGRWGEIQLRRVVEMAGMLEHCDFEEQAVADGVGRPSRPDMIVHLPGGRLLVVDAKAPLEAYLNAIEATDESERRQHLVRHARQIRDHIEQLGSKSYWEQFSPTPDFVVLFIPGESFFSAAVQEDPSLIEFGTSRRVIPASPTTLIVLLKAVAYGWRQQALEQNAQRVAEAGRELYKRLLTFVEHLIEAGHGLRRAVQAYNRSVASFQSRLMPCAQRFEELEVPHAGQQLAAPPPVDLDPSLPEPPAPVRNPAPPPSSAGR